MTVPTNSGFSLQPMEQEGESIVSAIWGNQAAPVSQPFLNYGVAASNFPNEDTYGIGDAAGDYHTGVDIGIPAGTQLYSPVAGTIACAGTDDGPGVNGGGCALYDCSIGNCVPGKSGRLEIQFGPGESLILGHVDDALVQPGQTVQPGTPVAISGGAGTGAHVHVEERVPASLLGMSTATGEVIVDPMNIIGGAVSGSIVGGGTIPSSTGDFSALASAMEQQLPQAAKRIGIGLLAMGIIATGLFVLIWKVQ